MIIQKIRKKINNNNNFSMIFLRYDESDLMQQIFTLLRNKNQTHAHLIT